MKFFIVGTGRCGTTLLWRMMNCHPDVFVFRETHWIVSLTKIFGRTRAPAEAMLDVVGRTNHVTGSPVTEFDSDGFRKSRFWRDQTNPAEFTDNLGAFLSHAQGKRFWADKTPDYGAHIAMLQQLWPDSKYIHLVRNGVQTARSMSRHIGYQALAALKCDDWSMQALDYTPPSDGFAKASMSCYPALWHDRLVTIRKNAKQLKPGSYLEVFHEDVLAAPRAALTAMATHVGLAWSDSWLDQASAMIENNRGGAHRLDRDMAVFFDDKHNQLLSELGYAANRDI